MFLGENEEDWYIWTSVPRCNPRHANDTRTRENTVHLVRSRITPRHTAAEADAIVLMHFRDCGKAYNAHFITNRTARSKGLMQTNDDLHTIKNATHVYYIQSCLHLQGRTLI